MTPANRAEFPSGRRCQQARHGRVGEGVADGDAVAGLKGLGGAKVEVVFADNQGSPATGQNQALRLITDGMAESPDGDAHQIDLTHCALSVVGDGAFDARALEGLTV